MDLPLVKRHAGKGLLMPSANDTFLAELGLQRADHATYPWTDDPEYRSYGQLVR